LQAQREIPIQFTPTKNLCIWSGAKDNRIEEQLTKRTMATLLWLILFGYVALIVLGLFSDRLIFQPQQSSYRDSSEILKLRSGDKQISAIYMPAPDAKYVLLFSHGNAEDIGQNVPWFRQLNEAGFSVFAYDYRGYGTSEGSSSEKTVYQDALASYEYLTGILRVAPDRIISVGRSLGSSAAIEIAYRKPVAGLVLQAPFLTAFRVLTRIPLLPFDRFRNDKKIGLIHVPVLFIHGRKDEVVPFQQGEALFRIANEPKKFVAIDGAGHNDLLMLAGDTYIRELRQFAANLPGISSDQD
jgi:abhydrolase domain-containing protein 17